MRFNTEEQRLAHPQACLIPSVILQTIFEHKLSDLQLDLMRASFEELLPRIEGLMANDVGKAKYWLCIALSHPGPNDDELIHVANKLGILPPELFRYAALIGRLSLINRLMRILPADKKKSIKYGHYWYFTEAAKGGHLPVFDRMIELLDSTDVLEMIEANQYGAFVTAAQGGHLHVMNRLMALAPSEVQNMIKAGEYRAFQWAAGSGHLHVLEKLITLAPAEVQNMVQAGRYRAFREAARNGHLAVMERLIALAPAEVQNMIKARDYGVFCGTARAGHLAVIERLIALAPTEVQNMIRAGNYNSFCEAAGEGQLAVMERLMILAPTEVQDMIKAQDYSAFNGAAQGGHLAVMEKLIELAPAELQNMNKPPFYLPFGEAARGGHLDVIEKLVALAPAEVQNMIKAHNYRAFSWAAQQGHLAVMERLMELAPAEVQNMIQYNHYETFRLVASQRYLPIINRLLSFSTQMADAEAHEREYSEFIYTYISEKLISLRNQRQTLEATHPHAVFDVTEANDAKCYFYIIRNLIRRNDPALLDDIRFLLDIPAVKSLAPQALTPGATNELVRLALRLGNEGAAQILLTIPAVRDLAASNDYYRAEVCGVIDLGALAHDRESSMHALSTGEQARIAAATARYQPIMQEVGVEHLFKHLLEALVERYKKNPAKINIGGVDLVLPADWDTFTLLNLTVPQRQDALKAYYQQKDHSALRYLSRPNHWMASDASYVYINDARTQRWSTFEEYKPLVVMLWLAAQDVTIAPTDGHTLEGRITHFIDELALIGRAHNWDHSRNRVNSSGHAINEEYDDLAGDKPSCFSGVKRRLFQSVIGHPLLKILTEEDIHQELRDFVRAHFASIITAENKEGFRNALMTYYSSVALADAAPLRALNISAEKQALFVQQLTEKYGGQFSGVETKFKSTIEKAFALVENKSNPSDCMHALKFAALANLEQFLPAAVTTAATEAGAAASSLGFFAGAGVESGTIDRTRLCGI